MDISSLRMEYKLRTLCRKDLAHDPIIQFHLWFDEALKAEVIEPNAFALASSSREGIPSCRMVLLKNADAKGFVFFTNLESRKAQELQDNPFAAGTFWWADLERQVLLEGKVERTTREEDELYFLKRPRRNQLGAWSSKQGSLLPSRKKMEENFQKFEEEFREKEMITPPFWGGFRIIPQRVEFWQGRENRLHDRFAYQKNNEAWLIERLSP